MSEFPAWMSWKRRGGAHLPQPEGRGPNGRRLCRWCASEVPKGSQSWCGDACVKRFLRVFSWQNLRQYIIDRDRVCSRCGCEHPGWKQSRGYSHSYVYNAGRWATGNYCPLVPWWEVDHIVRVTDGGDDNPDNLRLLCHACHIVVGYEQRADAKRRSA